MNRNHFHSYYGDISCATAFWRTNVSGNIEFHFQKCGFEKITTDQFTAEYISNCETRQMISRRQKFVRNVTAQYAVHITNHLTPWSWVLLEKPPVVTISQHLMEPEYSLPSSQEPVSWARRIPSVPHHPISLTCKIHFKIILPSTTTSS
jgi:hypothetical protein